MSKNILKFGIFGTTDKGGGRNLGKINVSAVGENKGLGQFHRYQLHLALFLPAFQKFFGVWRYRGGIHIENSDDFL